jgi:hypothetical protein
MGSSVKYNYDHLPVGTRIKVHAAQPKEGSDYDWHGYTGTIIEHGHWTLCRMDKKPRHWPSHDVMLCDFHLFPIEAA